MDSLHWSHSSCFSQYEVLLKLLEVHEGGRNEYAQKAEGYLNDMDNKFSTFFGLMLSHLIFSATEQLSITLQAMNTTMQDVVECSKLAISFLERQRVLNASILEDSKDLTLPLYFHVTGGCQERLMKQQVLLTDLRIQSLSSANSIMKHLI